MDLDEVFKRHVALGSIYAENGDLPTGRPGTEAVEEWIAWHDSEDQPVVDAEHFAQAISYAGRNEGPWLLSLAHFHRVVEADVVAALVGDVWSDAEHPEHYIERSMWLELFTAAGFTVNGQRARRPRRPVRLYRGAPEDFARRMSWTADRVVAEKFAEGFRWRQPGVVWTTLAPPRALLARVDDREESEYVVDPDSLVIEAVK